ncbi:MAG: adenylyltransferase/cytidyltransferase family protein, partial [Chitinophagaceae bacterium]
MGKHSSINAKILSLKQLLEKIQEDKKNVKKVVFTNGCFDILHRGHVTYLAQAKSLGDILVVG